MNIFITNEDPVLAARDLCDEHVKSKMQIEGAIMLAHGFSQELLNHHSTPRTKTGKPRKSGKGYYNHPCSVWVRESKSNFEWLVNHTLEQFRERRFRWPNADEHFTLTFIEWCKQNIHNTTIPDGGLTPFATAIGTDSVCRTVTGFNNMSVIDQYRLYIRHDKDFATWTKRPKPDWYI